MRTAWEEAGEKKQVVSPLSLIVTAFAAVRDARRTATPLLKLDQGETELILIDVAKGRNRLGGSALAQVYNATGNEAPDVEEPARLVAFFNAIQQLNAAGLMLAYHDRGDGGLLATVCEMAFASRCGVTLDTDILCYDPLMHDVDGNERRPDLLGGRTYELLMRALFAEELGAVIQIRRQDRSR